MWYRSLKIFEYLTSSCVPMGFVSCEYFEGVPINIFSLFFVLKFLVPSNKLLCDVFSALNCVVVRSISILSYSVRRRTIRSTAYSWSVLPLERALYISPSRFSSFECFYGGMWSADRILDKTGACTSLSMVAVFSMPWLSVVTELGCTLMIWNDPVLRGKSLWYAPPASCRESWSLVATSGNR